MEVAQLERLEVEQENLRAALLSHDGEGEASFDRGSAQHIAALCESKRGVNLDDLVNCKAASGISCPGELAAGDDPRE